MNLATWRAGSPLCSLASPWQAQRWPLALGCLALATAAGLMLAPAAPAPAPVLPPRPTRVAAAPQLPEAATQGLRLQALLEAAQRHGVVIERTEQQLRPATAPGLVWVLVATPARGRHGALRAWIAEALAQDPLLALDALQWRRVDAAGAELQAELSWAFAQRATAGAGP